MERLTLDASALPMNGNSNASVTSTESTLRHDGLYARLIQIFKEGFVTVNGEEPDRDWCDLFDRMTPKQLKRGVDNARDAKKDAIRSGKRFFPPDVDQFEVYCTTPRLNEPKALPNPYELSEAVKGTARFYGIDYENKTEDEVMNLVWEARQK